MKLQKIEIENFASYYGKHEPINLNVTDLKPLVIFVGGTGFGKTSFFDAINWALYGEEYEKDILGTKERGLEDYVNETALKEGYAMNERVEMSVRLYFEHSIENRHATTAREFYITQSVSVLPQHNTKGLAAVIKQRQTSLREITPGGDHVEIAYTRTFLDEILPNNVKSYFLFDGDRIHNLAKPGNSQEVRDAIYRVVDLEIIRNASEHLRDTAMEFGKRAARVATGELAEVEESYNEELRHQTSIRKRINDIKRERQAISDQNAKIDAKLKDLPASSTLQERKNALLKEIQQNAQVQKEAKNSMRDAAAKGVLYLALPQLQDLSALLKEKRARGEIPKHVRETFFRDLFSLEECICGTKFNAHDGDSIYETLKSRLEQEKNRSNEEDRLIDLYHQLNQAESLIRESVNDVVKFDDKIFELDEFEKNLRYEKQDIENQLSELPVEDITRLLAERKKREETDKNLLVELKTKETQLTASETKLAELDNKRKDLGKRQKEASSLHYRSTLAKQAGDELSNLYESFAEQSRKQVEQLTIAEFKKFVVSSSGYEVSLSSDYCLQVLDSNGNPALQRLSMGQSQCLSLAFITAISRVSRKKPPLVIDMPFSRLDPTVHEAISARLPKLANQAILFLIPDVEWNVTTRQYLSNASSHLYEMHFDENTRQTTITSQL